MWCQIDSWFLPKLVDACPEDVKQWVNMRARTGDVDDSHIILFWLYKQFAPGGADEKATIDRLIRNPQVCSQPKAAHLELMRWEENLKRNRELGCAPPDVAVAYAAMESMFANVFDKADTLLNHRWIQLRVVLGLPYKVDFDKVKQVASFAHTELSALV